MPTPSPFELHERALHTAWWMLEHLVTERRLRGPLGEARARIRRRLGAKLGGRVGRVDPVERRSGLTREEFLDHYFDRAEPVVLAGLAREWPATRRWSFEWLSDQYGAEPVCITDYGDPDFLPLAHAIDRLRGGGGFARFGAILHRRPELMADLDFESLARLRPRLSEETSRQFFIAGAGSVSPLHADGTCNFHVQLHGAKVWRIVRPTFNPMMEAIALGAPHFKSPLAPFDVGREGAAEPPRFDVLEAVLEPGDVLFNPSFFWHEVRYRAPSISVGVRWFSPTSFLRGSPLMALLMLTAQHPSVVEALFRARTGRIEGFYR